MIHPDTAMNACMSNLFCLMESRLSEKLVSNKAPKSRKVKIRSVKMHKNGFPDYLIAIDDRRYHFPEDIDFNPLRKIQLNNLLLPNSTVLVTSDELNRIHKLQNFSFTWYESINSSGESEENLNQVNRIFKNMIVETNTIRPRYKITLSIVSLSCGLLSMHEIFMTSVENLSLFFSNKTEGTAKVTYEKDDGEFPQAIPYEIFVIVTQKYLTYSIPELI